MKTLAVLSALATIAIAAPTLEGYTDSTSITEKHITLPQEREKKSILQETLSEKTSEHSEDRATAKTLSKLGLSGSFGFKKPIIANKKIGYHVYRDSDEEQAQADSRESCKNQIKVKLCDDNNSVGKLKSDSIDHTFDALSESEIQDSINMARVAVENFQKDLQKVKQSSAENGEHRHVGFGTDKELRDDIEKARQALEHIQRKIKSLDTIGRSQDNSNTHLKMEKSDGERLAQWKEFVNNQKDLEISQNLEDNFKLTTNLKDSSANNVDIKMKAAADIDDDNAQTNSGIEENKMEDIMTSITEGKKMELHSDNLKKDKSEIEDMPHNENTRSTLEENTAKPDEPTEKNTANTSTELKHSELKNSVDCKKHGNVENNKHFSGEFLEKDKESHVKSHSKIKSNEGGLDMEEQLTENLSENKNIMKTKADSSASDATEHMQMKLENQSHNGHGQQLSKNDEVKHESKQVENLSSTSNKETMHLDETVLNNEASTHIDENRANENLHHEMHEIPMTVSNNQEQAHNDADKKKQMDLSRSSQNQDSQFISSTHEANLHEPSGNGKFPERSALSKTISSLKTGQTQLKNHVDEKMHDHDNEKMHEHTVQSHVRATSDFHKEILNNMDFVDDSHQMPFNKPSLTDANHKLKKENSELHERFNLPQAQPISNHLEMKHSSDTFQDKTLQKQQLKMASMFNNEQPNFNAQFNFPQTFEEQTNVQEIRPFKEAVHMHDRHSHRSGSMHEEDHIPSDLHDPLKVRWAHDDHLKLDKLKVPSQFEQDSMKMDGSSQHFNIDKSMPISSFSGQHMDLDEKLKAHQRWHQENNMNTRKSMTMNSGLALQHAQRSENLQHSFPIGQTVNNFEQLHDHNSFVSRNNGHSTMMHGMSSIDTSMQPSSFMHMRETPKMAVDHIDHNRWSNNNAAFRSSYAPSMSASYGSGGISSSGGSAVGLFPNANVGNCAVPLLLSCSPSVVSGSLAKANTYSAPSYRSEDINFLRKRNTDIGGTSSGVKVNTLLGHQPRMTSDKKHI